MRNYFKALHLPTRASRETLTEALAMGSTAAKGIAPKHRVDAYDILLDDERRKLYVSTVELFEAMHIASIRLNESVGTDSHSWADRLAQFDTAVADSISLTSKA